MANGSLKNFTINEKNQIIFENQTIEQLYLKEKKNFNSLIEIERKKRVEAEKLRQKDLRKIREKEECRIRKLQKQREDTEKRQQEYEDKQRLEEETLQIERCQREYEFKRNMESNFAQQESPIRDGAGNRWVKCEFCGKIAKESEFNSYGGECGGTLRKKSSQFGQFIGCSNYPRCRFTRKI